MAQSSAAYICSLVESGMTPLALTEHLNGGPDKILAHCRACGAPVNMTIRTGKVWCTHLASTCVDTPK